VITILKQIILSLKSAPGIWLVYSLETLKNDVIWLRKHISGTLVYNHDIPVDFALSYILTSIHKFVDIEAIVNTDEIATNTATKTFSSNSMFFWASDRSSIERKFNKRFCW